MYGHWNNYLAISQWLDKDVLRCLLDFAKKLCMCLGICLSKFNYILSFTSFTHSLQINCKWDCMAFLVYFFPQSMHMAQNMCTAVHMCSTLHSQKYAIAIQCPLHICHLIAFLLSFWLVYYSPQLLLISSVFNNCFWLFCDI